MKEDLKNSWLKNNIIAINVVTILLYSIGFWLFQKFDFSLLINIVGSMYLLIITPINILLLLRVSLKYYTEWLLASISLFFTILVPLYFVANYLLQTPFSFKIILTFNLILSFFIFLLFHRQFNYILENIHWSINFEQFLLFIKKRWPLLAVLFLFILLHTINYHFYIFMPEWDGYSKLTEIQNVLETNVLTTNYRGFFTVAIIIITKFTQLSPYTIFTTLFILLQSAIILSIFLFLKIYNIKNHLWQFVILLTTLAVPMINLEIDVVRAQSVFIILLPIYIYFLFKAILSNKFTSIYWILITLIALTGLNYHEFFIFIFLLHATIISIIIFKKYYLQSNNKKDRLLLKLFTVILFLLGIVFINYFSVSSYFIVALNNIFHKISQIQNWRWWFIDDYAGDETGQQLGWPGISGAIKYYSYYTGPVILFILSTTLFLTIKKQLFLSKQLLLRISLPLLLLLLVYNELLPRIGYIYLPERIWIIVSILTIFISLSVYKIIQQNYSKKIISSFLLIILILNLIGIGGSLYIASQKKALTSKNEFIAAQWIKQNTPKNSLFFTQGSNGPMVKYFAKRKALSLNPSTNFISQYPKFKECSKIHLDLLKNALKIQDFKNINNYELLLKHNCIDKKYLSTVIPKDIASTELLINKINRQRTSPKYILYSNDKFKGLYAKREWWLKSNYHGTNPADITKKYPLVYNKDGIYIWKIK